MSDGATIKLGLLAPLTGLVGLYGKEICHAALIATRQVNESGGVLGKPLELVIEDDGSIPATAVPAGIRLVETHGCCAIIGNLLSNSRISVNDLVAERFRIPHLNFSFYEGSINSRYFFHFAALPNQQIHKMIPFMAKNFGPKFFFAGSNYEWPLGSIDSAKRVVRTINGETVGEEYLPIGSDQIDTLLSNVARSGADVFVPYFAGQDQVNLLTRFTQMGLKDRMQVVMGHYDEAMVGQLPPKVREGFYSSNTYFMSIDTPENRSYKKALAELPDVSGLWPNGNGVLTNFGEGTYICVHAFAKAANRAGSTETEAMIAALEHISVVAPQGEVIMDADTHHAHVNTYLARCDGNGNFSIVESFGRIPPIIPARYRTKLASDDSASGNPSVPTAGPAAVEAPAADQTRNSQSSNLEDVVFNHSETAILVSDDSGKIIDANPALARMFGYTQEELRNKNVSLLLPPRFRQQHMRHQAAFMTQPSSETRLMNERRPIYGYRKDGSEFSLRAGLNRMHNGTQSLAIVTLQDITQQKEVEERLTWQATHDPLTGLPNRAQITERLLLALQRSGRTKLGVGVIFVDIDNFKLINDTYGHATGDKLLVSLANRLILDVRAGDTVARFGGDEFVIISEQVSDSVAIVNLAERINRSVRTPIEIDGHRITTTVSLGVMVGNANDNPEDLLRKSDAAMYSAKDSGRDGWRFYSDDLQIKAKKQLDLITGLRHALENGEIRLVLQPIIDIRTNRINGAEALMRWQHGDQAISPAEFIPAAESSGTISQLGSWAFEHIVELCATWEKRGILPADFTFSINLSPRQFADAALPRHMKSILEHHRVSPRRIQLEITETALMQDIDATRDILIAMGETGLRIAVDDFGTGYSSLAQLVRLPVDCLKIDRMFVTDLTADPRNRAVASSIIGMAHAINMRVVAEGVETREQLQFLTEHRCDSAQGYLYYRPTELADCERSWLSRSEARTSPLAQIA